MPAACRHVSSHPGASRPLVNPADGAAVCFGRPADDVVDGTAGGTVEAEGGHAYGWQWLQGRGSRSLRCCRVYRIHSCAVGCGRGRRGADAGVEEIHIVSRHEAHPQTVEQSGEQGVGLLVLGHLRLE